MAENNIFISASDLPVASGTVVDVLCVEDGEMKRIPRDFSEDENADYDLSLIGEIDMYDPSQSVLQIMGGNFGDVIAKLTSLKPAKIRINAGTSVGVTVIEDVYAKLAINRNESGNSNEYVILCFVNGGVSTFVVSIFSDGSVYVQNASDMTF